MIQGAPSGLHYRPTGFSEGKTLRYIVLIPFLLITPYGLCSINFKQLTNEEVDFALQQSMCLAIVPYKPLQNILNLLQSFSPELQKKFFPVLQTHELNPNFTYFAKFVGHHAFLVSKHENLHLILDPTGKINLPANNWLGGSLDETHKQKRSGAYDNCAIYHFLSTEKSGFSLPLFRFIDINTLKAHGHEKVSRSLLSPLTHSHKDVKKDSNLVEHSFVINFLEFIHLISDRKHPLFAKELVWEMPTKLAWEHHASAGKAFERLNETISALNKKKTSS